MHCGRGASWVAVLDRRAHKFSSHLRRERARLSALIADDDQLRHELAERLNVTPKRLGDRLNGLDARDVSLDCPMCDDSGANLMDRLVGGEHPERQLDCKTTERRHTETVSAALRALDDRERMIIERHTMEASEAKHPLAQLARELGVSRERARQLELAP
jgi:DNA-directed RNA polymerase sigma subunit (sigma70/sigma32)